MASLSTKSPACEAYCRHCAFCATSLADKLRLPRFHARPQVNWTPSQLATCNRQRKRAAADDVELFKHYNPVPSGGTHEQADNAAVWMRCSH